jgi:hypothetical protein
MLLPLALTIFGLMGSAAQASYVSYSQAEADPQWITGSFKGEIVWDACTPKACRWTPHLFVIPTASSCDATRQSDTGEGRFVWSGPTRTTAGTFPFEASGGIIRGLRGQKTCMVATYLRERRDVLCEFDNPASSCPTVVDEWAMTVGSSVALVEAVPPETTPQEALILARGLFARKYGRSWRVGKQKRIRCQSMTTVYRCSARWRVGKSIRRGTVAVPK